MNSFTVDYVDVIGYKNHIISDNVQVTILAIKSLPCYVHSFTINDKEAMINDFGNIECPNINNGKCYIKFKEKRLKDSTILVKYDINVKEHSDILDLLTEVFTKEKCGWCS